MCSQNGDCTDNFESFSCNCHHGFETNDEGQTCTNINECSPEFDGEIECGPKTECQDTTPGYTCECSSGFFGMPYDKVIGCSKADKCANGEHNCDAQAICIFEDHNKFRCKCNEEYIGDGFTCKSTISYKI